MPSYVQQLKAWKYGSFPAQIAKADIALMPFITLQQEIKWEITARSQYLQAE